MSNHLRNKFRALAGVSALLFLGQHGVASTLTYTFQENDAPANTSTTLGNSSTFTEGGIGITASGFTTGNSASPLHAKYSLPNAAETGLGMANDSFGAPANDHEIDAGHYVQLNLSNLKSGYGITLSFGSVQAREGANIYYVSGGTAHSIGSVTTEGGSLDVTSYVQAGDLIDVTASGGDVLITSLVATSLRPQGSVPDSASTAALLVAGLSAMGLIRRKLA